MEAVLDAAELPHIPPEERAVFSLAFARRWAERYNRQLGPLPPVPELGIIRLSRSTPDADEWLRNALKVADSVFLKLGADFPIEVAVSYAEAGRFVAEMGDSETQAEWAALLEVPRGLWSHRLPKLAAFALKFGDQDGPVGTAATRLLHEITLMQLGLEAEK